MLGHPLSPTLNKNKPVPGLPLQAEELWQMKDGLCFHPLLRRAGQERLPGAPAARSKRGPLGAAGEEHGHQHLLAAEPSSSWPARGTRGGSMLGVGVRGLGVRPPGSSRLQPGQDTMSLLEPRKSEHWGGASS